MAEELDDDLIQDEEMKFAVEEETSRIAGWKFVLAWAFIFLCTLGAVFFLWKGVYALYTMFGK